MGRLKTTGWITYDEDDIIFHDERADEDVISAPELAGLLDLSEDTLRQIEIGELEIWLWTKTGKVQLVRKS
jgi:hypothetical protein